MTITLYNSKTRRKQPFQPIDPQNLRMYVCGPTVYDRAHLGNARPAIVFDVLYRLLRHTYGAAHVTYVRNFTDVDDKINAKARETGRSIGDICDETIGWYLDDMAAVGVMRPTHMPRATEYIPQMIDMIAGLIAGGHAYAASGHVLFRVRSYQHYGALSGRSVDDMIAGARVEVAPFKEDPMDFVLWKPSDAATPGWDSPWGYGRPGWHIECSAMAYELLGDTFDIHGGGLDLQFPHHENEVAQICCAHPQGGFAQVWMHNEMLQVEGKKMSKSLGNFFTVRDLLDKGVAGEVIRFVMLSTHYRKPMDWTEAKAREAEKTLDYLYSKVGDIEVDERWEPLNKVKIALADDLNTSLALTELISAANSITNRFHPDADGGDQESAAELKRTAALLGLLEQTESQWLARKQKGTDFAPLSNKLYELRRLAQSNKNFAEVDAFKAALTAAGVEVRMSKAGVELIPAAGFDPSKLEGLV
jgi:cysteinyl-tRNA synthetase